MRFSQRKMTKNAYFWSNFVALISYSSCVVAHLTCLFLIASPSLFFVVKNIPVLVSFKVQIVLKLSFLACFPIFETPSYSLDDF